MMWDGGGSGGVRGRCFIQWIRSLKLEVIMVTVVNGGEKSLSCRFVEFGW